MASLAEKRMEDAEDYPIDQNIEVQNPEVEARPEELRLLEALLFASAEPIDQATLAKRMSPAQIAEAERRARAFKSVP